MDLDVAIVLSVFGIFLAIIGYKALNRYYHNETIKQTSEDKIKFESKIKILENDNTVLENSRNGYRQKYNKLKWNYDIDLDDIELDEDEEDETKIIPALAEALFPKLPPKLKEILGKDEMEQVLFKVAEKNADKIPQWIEKYLFKDKGSSSNTAPKLTETYL